ncbi:MAG: RidA family protein [Deinococcaceae bacterium]
MKIRVETHNAPAALGPYSQAIVWNGLVFASGQIPLKPDGTLVEGIEAQTEQVFANIKAVLAEAGSDLSKVLKVTVFLADMNHFSQMNAIFETHVSKPYPARSTVQVARLPRDVLVEIEVTAYV